MGECFLKKPEGNGVPVRKRLTLAVILAALVCAAPAVAAPQDYLPNSCGRPFTGIWDSYQTDHAWIAQWTGTDIARGAPTDGVWRLYAMAYTAGWGDGWHFSYYYWTSCYY